DYYCSSIAGSDTLLF
nr:immunoglobulin light chain junction region [Macaca mulatta]